LYQGAYAELDDDIGWHDFMLRNYDAQTGRWVQQDPFQEFASPYIGIGGDPVNNTDPTGGFILCPGASALAVFLDKTLNALIKAGPITTKIGIALSITKTGSIIEKAVWTSAKINGQIRTMQAGGGYGANNSAGVARNSDGDDEDWKPLYKKDLIDYYKEKYKKDPTENELGKFFEERFSSVSVMKRFSDYPIKKNSKIFDDADDRNTQPDFIGDAKLMGMEGPIRIKDAVWFELKQKGGGLYLSSSDDQIKGHIDNIDAKFARLKLKYLKYLFRPLLVLITTADVKPSNSIYFHVLQRNIAFEHIHVEFLRKTLKDGTVVWQFRYDKVVSEF
jgi:RHS repeat-associated protein